MKRKIPDSFRAEYNLGDSGDPWGRVMAWRFALANYLCRYGKPIPHEWEYSPGAFGPACEGYEYDVLKSRRYGAKTLARIGEVLFRLARILEAQGRDY